MTARPRGFTLIELLVTIAVVAVLIGLLLPAVQKVRAAAARLNCQSHLKQIGLAAQNYHAVHQTLPPGVTASSLGEPFKQMSWLTRLLPHLEQDSLWNMTVSAYQKEPGNMLTGAHVGVKTPIRIFACPVDERLVRPHITHNGFYAALTSYQGVSGTDYTATDGTYYYGSSTRLTDIIDGTSNTLAVGERPPSPDYFYGWWYASAVFGKQGGLTVLGAREYSPPNDPYTSGCPRGPYVFKAGDLTNQCDVYHFWSLHSGGGNFAFCDGSVRFLAYSAEAILPALATRSGGEVVEIP